MISARVYGVRSQGGDMTFADFTLLILLMMFLQAYLAERIYFWGIFSMSIEYKDGVAIFLIKKMRCNKVSIIIFTNGFFFRLMANMVVI